MGPARWDSVLRLPSALQRSITTALHHSQSTSSECLRPYCTSSRTKLIRVNQIDEDCYTRYLLHSNVLAPDEFDQLSTAWGLFPSPSILSRHLPRPHTTGRPFGKRLVRVELHHRSISRRTFAPTSPTVPALPSFHLS